MTTTDHVTHRTISHVRLGHAQQMKHTHNAQTHMANVQVNKYHV